MTTRIEEIGQRYIADKGRPSPLLAVIAWELRRKKASRATWLGALAFFTFFLFIAWLMREISLVNYTFLEKSVTVSGGSAWGAARTIPRVMLLAFGLFLPFLSADLVARDLKRRTHGILMPTAIPGWAYVWGRYLAGLLISLGVAMLMLPAMVAVGLATSALAGSATPDIIAILTIWGISVLPVTVLVTGLSFALGTLLPRYSNVVKIVVLTAWFSGMYFGFLLEDQSWYTYWNPTSRGMSYVIEGEYHQELLALVRSRGLATNADEQDFMLSVRNADDMQRYQQSVRDVEQRPPDVSAWLVPQLAWTALGLLSVMPAGVFFRRFRGVT